MIGLGPKSLTMRYEQASSMPSISAFEHDHKTLFKFVSQQMISVGALNNSDGCDRISADPAQTKQTECGQDLVKESSFASHPCRCRLLLSTSCISCQVPDLDEEFAHLESF